MGAHLAVVGEQGREYVVNAWASKKVEAQAPGALAALNRGELPARPVPAGVGAGAPAAAVASYTFNQAFTLSAGVGIDQAREFAAEWRRQMAQWQAQQAFTYGTPTARGAR